MARSARLVIVGGLCAMATTWVVLAAPERAAPTLGKSIRYSNPRG